MNRNSVEQELPIKISLPNGFLDEEIRCDYHVTKKMKEVWAIELDLLSELDRVCRKYNITYFADGGTILGAIRHQGYIPWDDDIDIALMRSEYTRLCEVASEFKTPYFFQTEYSDPGTLRGHAQLRNSMTTGALTYEAKYCWFNQGIFLDIFPIDTVTDQRNEFERQRKKIAKLKHRAAFFGRDIGNYDGSKGIRKVAKHILNPLLSVGNIKKGISRKTYAEFESLCQLYNNEESKMCSLLSYQAEWNRLIRGRSDYESTVMKKFEFLEIPLPIGYENVLHYLYGDYMKIVKDDTAHGGLVLDARTPYTVYLKQNYDNKNY